PTHTSAGVDLAGIAITCGFRQTATVRQVSELDAAVAMLHTAKGPVLVVLKVSSARDPRVLPPWDAPFLRSRFREALRAAHAVRRAKRIERDLETSCAPRKPVDARVEPTRARCADRAQDALSVARSR